MGRWLFALGGLLVWTGHFLGVYLIASLAHLSGGGPHWTWIWSGFSIACVVTAVALAGAAARRARRREPSDGASQLLDQLAVIGGGLASVAIIWQSLPALSELR
jgi:hypothetical protein